MERKSLVYHVCDIEIELRELHDPESDIACQNPKIKVVMALCHGTFPDTTPLLLRVANQSRKRPYTSLRARLQNAFLASSWSDY